MCSNFFIICVAKIECEHLSQIEYPKLAFDITLGFAKFLCYFYSSRVLE